MFLGDRLQHTVWAYRLFRRPRNDRWYRRRAHRISFRRITSGCAAIGCGSLVLGVLGGGAGAMWSLALGLGAGVGALWGGLAIFILGIILIPLNNQVGTSIPMGLISVALLLFLMVLGALFWGIGAAVT